LVSEIVRPSVRGGAVHRNASCAAATGQPTSLKMAMSLNAHVIERERVMECAAAGQATSLSAAATWQSTSFECSSHMAVHVIECGSHMAVHVIECGSHRAPHIRKIAHGSKNPSAESCVPVGDGGKPCHVPPLDTRRAIVHLTLFILEQGALHEAGPLPPVRRRVTKKSNSY
jgi:hypothetical protein